MILFSVALIPRPPLSTVRRASGTRNRFDTPLISHSICRLIFLAVGSSPAAGVVQFDTTAVRYRSYSFVIKVGHWCRASACDSRMPAISAVSRLKPMDSIESGRDSPPSQLHSFRQTNAAATNQPTVATRPLEPSGCPSPSNPSIHRSIALITIPSIHIAVLAYTF